MSTEIVVDLALVDARPPLRALADVILRWSDGELTIHRCAVFQKPGEPAWANFPRLPVEKNGKKQFVPLVDLTRHLKYRALEAVLKAYLARSDAL